MTRRHQLLVGLAAVHLLLATGGVLDLARHLPKRGPLAFIDAYAHWAGVNTRFNFFAPKISSGMRLSFDITRGSGEVVQDTLGSANPSVNHRVSAMLFRFAKQKTQDDLVRAWAATMFGRYPDAQHVTVHLSVHQLPTMEAWRDGARPEWKEFYRAELERRRPAPPTAPEARP